MAEPPRVIYERVARRAARCWFGPFGSLHRRYMMHADVPPPSSKAPVTMTVHRRLASRKRPWGPALLRVEFIGKSSTTLVYKNVGMTLDHYNRMTEGLARWANGRTDCPSLDKPVKDLPLPVRRPKRKARR